MCVFFELETKLILDSITSQMDQRQRLTTGQYHAYDNRIANEGKMDKYPCPCKICLGGKVKKRCVIIIIFLGMGITVQAHSGTSPWVVIIMKI